METNSQTQANLWLYCLIGILTTVVVLAFARLSYGVILPFMRDGLHITYKEAGFLGTTTSLGYVSTLIVAGILAAKWGSKKTILLGISLVTLGLIGLSFTSSYVMAFLFMLLLGIGTSFTYTPFISLLVAWFPQKRGFVIGMATSGAGIGILFAGIIVPFLSRLDSELGWRFAWGTYAIIGLTVVLLTFLFIKNPPEATEPGQHAIKTNPKEVYKNRHVIHVGLIYGIVGLTYIVQVIFIMSFMLESGIPVKYAGQLMALNGILSIFSGPVWGKISDHLGRRTSLIATMGLVMVSMLVALFFPTMIGFTIHTILISCTSTGLFTLTQASSMDYVKPADMPIAFSYVTFYFAVGQLVGPAFAGWLIEDWGGFKSAFLFTSICLAVGLLLTIKLKKSAPEQAFVETISTKLNKQITH
ncbi:MFS transporter [Neobacillus dielmonensis]|uniref:MFS transporter n=1 Tax=Neobacillus dielmonensis TaxID=1347369 RepID=UPI0006940244|nr:MFS transporter [Neobacillus dielmonensis]